MNNNSNYTLEGIRWIIRIAAIALSGWLFLDYLYFNPNLALSISLFPYWGFLLTAIGLFGVLVFGLKDDRFKIPKDHNLTFSNIRGWMILTWLIIMVIIFFKFYLSKNSKYIQEGTGGLSQMLSLLLFAVFGSILLTISAFASGRRFVNFLSPGLSLASKRLISICTGFGILCFAGLFIGAMGLFNTYVCWLIIILPIALNAKPTWRFIQGVFINPIPKFSLRYIDLIPLFFLFILVGINLLGMLRPIPIGFDSLTLYMNTPKLISEYEALIQGGQAYNWSIIMAYGFSLFQSTELALYLSMIPGVIAVVAIIRILSLRGQLGDGLFAAALFYATPMVIWQSQFEAKVDLALVMVSTTTILAFYELFLTKNKLSLDSIKLSFGDPTIRALILISLLLGFGIGVKYTLFFVILGLISIGGYVLGGALFWTGFMAFIVGVSFIAGLEKFAGLDLIANHKELAFSLIGLSAVIGVFFLVRRRVSIISFSIFSLVMGAGILLAFLPWPIKNLSEHGQFKLEVLYEGKEVIDDTQLNLPGSDSLGALTFNRFELYAQNSTDESIKQLKGDYKYGLREIRRFYWMNPFSDLNKDKYGKGFDAKREEINRYLGYEPGAIRYLSIPYDVSMGINVGFLSNNVGPIYICLIPLLFLFFGSLRSSLLSLGSLLVFTLWLSISVFSVYDPLLKDTADYDVSNLQWEALTALKPIWLIGLKVFFGIGTLFSGLYNWLSAFSTAETKLLSISLFFIAIVYWFVQSKSLKRDAKALLAFSACYLLMWYFFASGIGWYAMPVLPVLIIAIFRVDENESVSHFLVDRTGRFFLYGICILWIGMSGLSRVTNKNLPGSTLVNENTVSETIGGLFGQYLAGMFGKDEIVSKMNPQFPVALNSINSNLNSRVLRIGTYLNYYIEQNDQRVIEDNQLQYFNNLFEKNAGQKEQINSDLRKAGVGYILMDLNTNAIDNTPDKSLTKKVQRMYGYLQNNPDVSLVVTDRLVVDQNSNSTFVINGQQVKGSYSVYGNQIIRPGSFALFQILN